MMNDIEMSTVYPDPENNDHSINVTFHIGDKKHTVFYRSMSNTVLSENPESYLAAALLPSMKCGGEGIKIKGDMSQKFISNVSTIQDIYSMWDTSLSRVRIKTEKPVIKKNNPSGKRVGAFFSGGVDSFYTFLKHQDQITDLIFVHGFDIRLSDTVLRKKVSLKIREIASNFGKNLIEIETNIRELLNPYIHWQLAYGAALAAVGHLLYPHLHRIFIPTNHTYVDIMPGGSHPVLDPLWGSETLSFINDGCEATRVKKVSLVSNYEIALQSLRVCWKNPNSEYNCGRCEKCLRTMINLEVSHALHDCKTFDKTLDIKRVSKIVALSENVRSYVRENLDALENSQGNQDLKKALQKVLNRPLWPYKIKKKLQNKRKEIKNRFTPGNRKKP